MRLSTSEALWGIVKLWYTCFGVVALAMLGTARQEGDFGKLVRMFATMRPLGWAVIIAILAPGPLAHWAAVRTAASPNSKRRADGDRSQERPWRGE